MKLITFTSEPENFTFNKKTRKRVKKITAELAPGNVKTTPRQATDPPQPLSYYQGDTSDPRHPHCNRGHLIALELGGAERRDNLVPMYGKFNKSGKWRNFEAKLKTITEAIILDIECVYTAPGDARIPSTFKIKAVRKGTTDEVLSFTIKHPPPDVKKSGSNAAKKKQYERLEQEMKGMQWDAVEAVEAIVRDSSITLPSGDRPYAFLDFMDWKEAHEGWFEWLKTQRSSASSNASYTSMLYEDWLKTIPAGKSRVNHPVWRWANGFNASFNKDFTDDQRDRILATNRILKGGYLVSDDPQDQVHTSDVYKIPNAPRGVLLEGSEDQAPQVDHIFPQSRGGAGVYSNAQVISALSNQRKGRQPRSEADAESARARSRSRSKGRLRSRSKT